MRNDLLADCFSALKNCEHAGKQECIIKASKLISKVLSILQHHGFIGQFEFIDDGRGGKFKIQLCGKINQCNSIKPRFSVKKNDLPELERRYLPAAGIGLLILTTSDGIMTASEAQAKGIGGKLLGFIY